MPATTSLLYRLGIEGDDQVKAKLQSVGAEEEKQVNRAIAAADRKAERITQIERQLEAAKKAGAQADEKAIAMVMGEVQAYEQLQRTANGLTPALNKTTVSAGQQRAGMQQLSFQISDVASGLSQLPNVSNKVAFGMQIMSQQMSQVIQAIVLMRGTATGFVGFLAGPWGAALTGAATIAAVLGSKLLDESEASKEAAKEAKKHEDAIVTLIKAQRDAILTEQQKLALDAQSIAGERDKRAGIVKTTIALLEQAKAVARIRESEASGTGGSQEEQTTAFLESRAAARRVAQLEGDLASARSSLRDAEQSLNIRRNLNIANDVKTILTPQGRIERAYEAERGRIAGGAYGNNESEIRRRYEGLEAWRVRETKAIEDGNKALKAATTARDADTLSSRAAGKLLRDALPGIQINSYDRTVSEQQRLYDKWVAAGRPADNPVAKPNANAPHVRGNALDVQFGKYSADDIRKAFADRGVEVTKILTERGHFHIEWEKGRAAVDNYADGVKRAAEAHRAAIAEKRDLMQLLGLFDPAGEAAAKYADQLERIDKLLRGGAISSEEALGMRRNARLMKFDEDSKPPVNSDAVIANAFQGRVNFDAPIFDDAWRDKQEANFNRIVGVVDKGTAAMIDTLDVLKRNGREAIDNIFSVRGLQDFEGAFSHLMESILNDLLQLAIANPLKNLLFGGDGQGGQFPGLGSGGGIFGGLFNAVLGGLGGGIGGGSGVAGGGSFFGLGRGGFATGTAYAPGGWATVGETGPERVRLPRGAQVMSAAATRAAVMGGGSGISAPVTINLDARGAGLREVDMLMSRLRQLEADLPGTIVKTVADAQQRRILAPV